MAMHDNGFTPRIARAPEGKRHHVVAAEVMATVALAVSTLAVAAVLSIGVAHAGAADMAAQTTQDTPSLAHVLDTLAGGLGAYAALRVLQRD
jgi:threonine/homoserine/homoserine lactone efflux protein